MRFSAFSLIFTLASLTLAAPLAADEETPAGPETIIATVNGEEVTLGELIALRAELPTQYQAIPDVALYEGLRDQIASQILLRQAAEREGLQDRPAVKRALAFQRTSYLAGLYIDERLSEQITLETVEAEYEKRYLNGPEVLQYKARHILVPDEQEAVEIAEEARKEGADFAEIAKLRSTGPSGPNGGDLGWFEAGQMVAQFQEAAFALKPGEVSDPVQTQFGWHVILLEGTRPRPAPALDEVRDELISQMRREVTEAVVAALRENGDVSSAEGQPGLDQLRNDSLIAE